VAKGYKYPGGRGGDRLQKAAMKFSQKHVENSGVYGDGMGKGEGGRVPSIGEQDVAGGGGELDGREAVGRLDGACLHHLPEVRRVQAVDAELVLQRQPLLLFLLTHLLLLQGGTQTLHLRESLAEERHSR